ncbi:MAG: ABC-F family ATP-binding cassette domain-containing protein [Desulfatiglandaceae bacterium]
MSLVIAIKVSVTFVDRELFTDVSFQIEPGERIGLVGPNGSGKTTLLRLLNGEVLPDSGEIRFAKGVRVGYLPQDVQETVSGRLLDSVVNSVPGSADLERETAAAEADLSRAEDKEAQSRIAGHIAELQQRRTHLDMQYPLHEAEKILVGLGFKEEDFSRSTTELSGGWKTRAALASLLFQKPDLLLLDEPTNHLDIPSVRWLEGFMPGFKGSLILVSHDREFLNRQAERIISFEPEGVRSYSGNFEFYLKARDEERRLLEAKARKQDQRVKEAQKFIDRFRAKASKARQAQSKLKLVKKMEMVETHRRDKTIRFKFPEVTRSGRDVVTIEQLSKAYGDNVLYRGLNLKVLRGERIAVIGANGAGKTTLLKMIAGEITPDAGQIRLGHGVTMGYFAQHQAEKLNLHNSVVEEVSAASPEVTVGYIRNVCGAFLFSGNDVEKPVGVLSGGEKARVSLAKLLVNPGNLMVMDEPTNHLDLDSSEMLISALDDYEGTLLFVSHNQFFVNRLATKVWDIRGGDVVEYPGNLSDYYRRVEQLESAGPLSDKQDSGSTEISRTRNASDRKADKRERAERRAMVRSTLAPLTQELAEVEARIDALETRQKEVEKLLADPELFSNTGRSVPLMKEYKEIRETQEDLLKRWEKLQLRLEETKADLGV